MPDAVKYPLAYLNLAIFSYQNHNLGPSWKYLHRYLEEVDNKRGGTAEQNGNVRNVRKGMRFDAISFLSPSTEHLNTHLLLLLSLQHLKVAKKLMCLLKLISDEPDSSSQENGFIADITTVGAEATAEGSVIASHQQQQQVDDVLVGSDYKGKDGKCR